MCPEAGNHRRVIKASADRKSDGIDLHAPLGLEAPPNAPGKNVRRPKDGTIRACTGVPLGAAFDEQAEDGCRGSNVVSLFVFGIRIVFNVGGLGINKLTASPDTGQLDEFFRRPESPSAAKMAFW